MSVCFMRDEAKPSDTIRPFSLILILALMVSTLPPSLMASAATRARANEIDEAFISLAQSQRQIDPGAIALGKAIARLGVVASVLHTGAHPDDEDSSLLAYLARGRQARTAYLSLTRGDGGQNLIGPELYESLGVIRTEELLAARRIDGAGQFFTRAYDFGFSKSRAEALSKWDREAVLSDMVRVIRTFRPMIIVACWSGTPNDGHGHHQGAGLLTVEAFHAAGDAARFPEQIREGLRPWQPKKLYVRSGDRGEQSRGPQLQLTTLSINTGQYDPLLGRGYGEIATQGRNQHRSQDQDAVERRGPRYSRLRIIENKIGPAGEEKDLFDGINITLTGIADFAGDSKARLIEPLSEVRKIADEAMAKFNPFSISQVTPVIARGLKRVREIRAMLPSLGLTESELYDMDFLLRQKEDDFADALLKSAGAVVDALSDDEIVTPGQTFSLRVESYSNQSAKPPVVSLSLPEGWTAIAGEKKDSSVDGRLISTADFKVTVAKDAEPSEPYWLKNPRKGDMFSPGRGGTGIEPHVPPPVVARADFEIEGERVTLSQAAQYRYAGKAEGELRHEIKVAPVVSVNVSPNILIYPKSSTALKREVAVSVTNNSKQGARGTIRLEGVESWQMSPADGQFDLKREGEQASFTFIVTVPPNSPEVRRELRAVASIDGKQFTRGYEIVSYHHIEPRFVFQPAEAQAQVIDAKVAPGLKVGYIEGAGDDFANALKRLGVDVEVISERELASGDLSRFDTIVLGIRVYELRPDVIANNARLLDYVNRGGSLIVQYNRGNFEEANYGPYPMRARRPQAESERAQVREPRLLYLEEATIKQALAARVAAGMKVGFIGSASDQLLKDSQAAGINIKLIEASELETGSLSQFDVIITGAGASKTRPDMISNNARLVDYARRGSLIVAYSKADFASGNFAEYPKLEARPYRVTDEQAAVAILDNQHPLFNFPNRITARDFEGWVTERGAYFLSEYDPRFKPLLASKDVGEEPLRGGEVVAEYGKGFYIYTAYAWFRQLPRGVPGAYRLIANLVSLPKASRKNN